MRSSVPRYRARSKAEQLVRRNRIKILAAVAGLAAAIGLLLADVPFLTDKTVTAVKPSVSTPAPQPTPALAPQTLTSTISTPSHTLTSALLVPSSTLTTPSNTQTSPNSTPHWVANASQLPRTTGPQLAIVIDDMGEDIIQSKQTLETMPETVTLAFLPYPKASPSLAKQAREQGHELLIHLPMQPKSNVKEELSPQTSMLLTTDAPEVLQQKIISNLKYLSPLVIGINNHMGSAFTQHLPGMQILLKELDNQQLMFLDSLTIAPTATRKAAAGLTIPILTRNVFLDDVIEESQIEHQLNRAIAHAKQHGTAIAIGHPHQQTLAVLQKYLSKFNEEGVTLVPLTHLLPAHP